MKSSPTIYKNLFRYFYLSVYTSASYRITFHLFYMLYVGIYFLVVLNSNIPTEF